MQYLTEQIKKQEKSNEQIVLDYWIQVFETGNLRSQYESLEKKLISYASEKNLQYRDYAQKLLNLDDFAKSEVLKHWVIKAERQNLNEEWKKDYIRNNSKMSLIILPKSGEDSLHLNSEFNIVPKRGKKNQSDKSKGIKTFDYILLNSKHPETEGYTGILVVDKTVKVSGGSQMDVQKEIDSTIQHLSMDPKKRKYLILLDGQFFYNYVQENKGKFENIIFSTTDELIENHKK